MSLNSYMVLYTGCFLLHSHKKELIDLVYCPVSAACMCTVQLALASLKSVRYTHSEEGDDSFFVPSRNSSVYVYCTVQFFFAVYEHRNVIMIHEKF